jgi:hypothetical protein
MIRLLWMLLLGFICAPCKRGADYAALPMPTTRTAAGQRLRNIKAQHDACRGSTWCDCQHKEPAATP